VEVLGLLVYGFRALFERDFGGFCAPTFRASLFSPLFSFSFSFYFCEIFGVVWDAVFDTGALRRPLKHPLGERRNASRVQPRGRCHAGAISAYTLCGRGDGKLCGHACVHLQFADPVRAERPKPQLYASRATRVRAASGGCSWLSALS
jgi:hypothetical protein